MPILYGFPHDFYVYAKIDYAQDVLTGGIFTLNGGPERQIEARADHRLHQSLPTHPGFRCVQCTPIIGCIGDIQQLEFQNAWHQRRTPPLVLPAHDLLRLLSPRERDCLRLLCDGFGTSEVAAQCGISKSTLNKHLASARQKLGVSKTSIALLIYQKQKENELTRQESVFLKNNYCHSSIACDFMNTISTCNNFFTAWQALQQFSNLFGVLPWNFGLIAEPHGSITNGGQIIGTCMPTELEKMYHEFGDVAGDPMAYYIAMNEDALLSDIHQILNGNSPFKSGKDFYDPVTLILDCNYRFFVAIPCIDECTGASYGIVYSIQSHCVSKNSNYFSKIESVLGIITKIFWDFVQSRRFLSSKAAISNRELEALRYVARGFRTEEIAEHMGVSRRFAEKSIAGARSRFGAPTTSAAIYRAMVYRAL